MSPNFQKRYSTFMRQFFTFANIGLGFYFLLNGLLAYRGGFDRLDAGVIPLFLSFWFGLAAWGFHQKNVWVVTTACLGLVGFEMLALFIQGLGIVHSGLVFTPNDQQTMLLNLSIIAFALAGEIYAMVADYRRKSRDR